MPILVRSAKTSEDLDEILRLRFRSLQKEGARLSEEMLVTQKSVDPLDIFPDSLNLYALVKGEVQGAIRAVRYSPLDPMMNLVFNFKESFAGAGKQAALIDQLVLASGLKPQIRETVFIGLLKYVLLLLAHQKMEIAFVNIPQRFWTLSQSLGFEATSESFLSPWLEDQVVPARIWIHSYESKCFESVIDKEIIKFKELFTLTLFEPGEILAAQGEKGQTAYLIEDGQVDVVLDKEETLTKLATLKKGQLIGELAMITKEPRTASLIAAKTTTCYTIERGDFLHLLEEEPYRSLDLFKICSKRLESVNKRLAQLTSEKQSGSQP